VLNGKSVYYKLTQNNQTNDKMKEKDELFTGFKIRLQTTQAGDSATL
jgi:hypothetical protein